MPCMHLRASQAAVLGVICHCATARVLQGLGCDNHLQGHCLTIDVAKLPAGSEQGPAVQIAPLQQAELSPDSLFIMYTWCRCTDGIRSQRHAAAAWCATTPLAVHSAHLKWSQCVHTNAAHCTQSLMAVTFFSEYTVLCHIV